MARFGSTLAIGIALLVSTTDATGTAMFPSIRKKLEKQKLAEAEAKAVKESQQEDAPGPNEPIPASLDAGADGFPVLPTVSKILDGASSTLKNVDSQATAIRARVGQLQMQSEVSLGKQKAAYEEKLRAQELSNKAVIAQNSNISAEIQKVQEQNAALRTEAKDLKKSNHELRAAVKTLESKMGLAKDFAAKTLTVTDDSKQAVLAVLKKPKVHQKAVLAQVSQKDDGGKEHDSDKDGDDDDTSDDSEDDNNGDSKDDTGKDGNENDEDGSDDEGFFFLETSSSIQRTHTELDATELTVPEVTMPLDSNPSNLLSELSQNVAQLAQQEKESELKLKDFFIRDYKAGAKRRVALLQQQKKLAKNRSDLESLRSQLEAAVSHLSSTKAHLGHRLKSLGQFLQKLAHVANAPEREQGHLLDSLPVAVM